MENLEIWNKYKAVPENAMKYFNNGNFKGTDINTMWRLKSLTETFGIAGVGWYYDIIRTWNENCVDGEDSQCIMTFAEIKLYIKVNGEWSKGISGVGGNKMLTYIKKKDDGTGGYYKPNDEAIKMAVTDAIGVACRNLGFGADVYWANDKTKYTEFVEETELKNVSEENRKTQEAEFKKFEETNPTTNICCENCGEELTQKVADYSKSKFGKYLCYKCQKADFKTKSFGG